MWAGSTTPSTSPTADENSTSSQPKRFTLWEIHPITAVLVCKREDNNCDPIVSDDWTLSSRARPLLPGDGEVKQWPSAALASGS
jgi:hypothetical protein